MLFAHTLPLSSYSHQQPRNGISTCTNVTTGHRCLSVKVELTVIITCFLVQVCGAGHCVHFKQHSPRLKGSNPRSPAAPTHGTRRMTSRCSCGEDGNNTPKYDGLTESKAKSRQAIRCRRSDTGAPAYIRTARGSVQITVAHTGARWSVRIRQGAYSSGVMRIEPYVDCRQGAPAVTHKAKD